MCVLDTPAAADAAKPVRPPVIDLAEVYVAHFMYGAPNAPSIDAAATTIAARGPKTTAANRVGRSEIDSSRYWLIRTRPRSAIAAIAPSPAITSGLGKDHPARRKPIAMRIAVRASEAVHAAIGVKN